MSAVRFQRQSNKLWFPIVDLIRYSKSGKSILPNANKWFKNNIPSGSLCKLKFKGDSANKGGMLLCVDSDNVKIIGVYEAHLQLGKDFRAKWSELPDVPVFQFSIRKELSWLNLYKWSKSEHLKHTGTCSSELSKMRKACLDYQCRFGNDVGALTYEQTLDAIYPTRYLINSNK